MVVTTRVRPGEGDLRFFAEDAQPLEPLVAATTRGFRLHVSPDLATPEALRSRLTPAATGGEIRLLAVFAGGREVEVKLPGRYALDAPARAALKVAPGVALLEDA